MRSQKLLYEPVAMLVIYEKGFKFKYTKYYLHLGRNEVGSNSNCTVNLPRGDDFHPHSCVINITPELATIEAVEPKCLFVPSNMQKKNLLVELAPGVKYVIEMEKDFSICGRKAIMQVSPHHELLQIKGVHNADKF